MKKILVVEDDDSIRNLIMMTLSIDNYNTAEAADGEKAYEMIMKNDFDLVLLDIMIPKIDGLQLLQKIKDTNIPVIFLTAKIELQDKIMGLKLGAEDYITKPFEPMELLARVEVILRRYEKTSSTQISVPEKISYNDIDVYLKQRTVEKNGQEIALTVKEFDLLKLLIENQDIVFSRESLLEKVWGYEYYGGTRTVDMHVKQLREKLDLKTYLETVFKVGYKLKSKLGRYDEVTQ